MIGKNNIFNLRYSPLNNWIGLCSPDRSTKGFCNFRSKEYCIRAVAKMVFHSYKNLHGDLTVYQIIKRFAPPKENDTDAYVNYVCNCCGCFPWDVPGTLREKADMLYSMAKMEIGVYNVSPDDYDLIINVLKKYNL